MSLHIKNLQKSYDDLLLFSNFNLDIAEGEITCILGPSGGGKTTLLNIIAGLVEPTVGSLVGFNGKVLSYIFQDPRLLPWKTVQENIEFVLTDAYDQTQRQAVANRFIKLVELTGFASYYPSQLSGGMRQRVAIARAFAYPSDLILMDEPLKGLDVKLKMNLLRSFSRIWQTDKRTVIFVTHDVDEALMLGNTTIVLGDTPITVKARVSIDIELQKRDISSDYFKNIRQILHNALGE
ncbi:MAG: ATP-binding cassette domain-containing protein [Tenuifilaceae bacterium]|jgi:NitT/TauT family transport system ATP-binding protein|nr:ATP-binding cassette domain-containing protein [Tenuifilaceae bacterium]